jgi:hypothetical protein
LTHNSSQHNNHKMSEPDLGAKVVACRMQGTSSSNGMLSSFPWTSAEEENSFGHDRI